MIDHNTSQKKKGKQLEIIWRLLEIRVCKKVLLKEEMLPHYQNSQFFRTYANSNKMSDPLHVRINGCMFFQRSSKL